MPIKGLTDRGLMFPKIGDIRKGIKENDSIRDLKHFRIVLDEKEEAAAKILEQEFGKAPDELAIMLASNEVGKVWDANMEAYTASRMVARGDGEHLYYWVDTKTGQMLATRDNPVKQPEDGIVGYTSTGKPIKLHAVGRLNVMFPCLGRAVYLTLHTTSMHDVINISSQLEAIKELANQLNNGSIAGIPLFLRRRPKVISAPKPKTNERIRVTKYLVSIEPSQEWMEKKFIQMRQLAFGSGELPLLAPTSQDVIESDYLEEDEEITDLEMIDIPPLMDAGEQAEQFEKETADKYDLLAKKDVATAFWSLNNDLGYSREDGVSVIAECGGDIDKAFKALRKNMPPKEG